MQAFKRSLLWILTLLFFYTLIRLLFLRANWATMSLEGMGPILWSIVLGLRYDIAAICLCNLPFVLLYILFPESRRMNFGIAAISALINGVFFMFNLFDTEYFKFTGKRLTIDSFAISQDINVQIWPIALEYWYNSLIIIGLAVAVFFVTRRLLATVSRGAWPVAGFLAFLAVLAGGLAIRGGLQTKPLIPAQAFVDAGPKLGILTLNSTFTILKSSGKEALTEWKGMPWETVQQTIQTYESEGTWNGPRPKNVVLVILESFGSEYVFPPPGHEGYAPFLKELAERGSNFPETFANGRRSIDALPALMAGIPAWMDPPFITSPYQTNQIRGLPEVLNENGYHSIFFHGGNNGTMFFDVMTKRLGFTTYVGAKEYPRTEDHDGRWGIFDEPFMLFVADRLSEETKPFFATVFTLSSHHPYTIPKQHQGRFPKGTLEIHESVAYADFALRRFYESAEKQPWFKDTLFIFTADHTSKQEYKENDNLRGRFRVPLLFLMNNQPLNFPATKDPVQHADLAPTVLTLLGLQPKEFSHFGSSLALPLKRPGIVLYESATFHLITKEASPSLPFGEKAWRPLDPLTDKASDLSFLQAQAYLFNNGMVRNRLLW